MTITEPREQCFELFRIQNSQNFLGLCTWTPLTIPPDSSAAQWYFSLLCLLKTDTPKKLWIKHCIHTYIYKEVSFYMIMFLNCEQLQCSADVFQTKTKHIFSFKTHGSYLAKLHPNLFLNFFKMLHLQHHKGDCSSCLSLYKTKTCFQIEVCRFQS